MQDYIIIFNYIWQSSDTGTNLDSEIISGNQMGVSKGCFKLNASLGKKGIQGRDRSQNFQECLK